MARRNETVWCAIFDDLLPWNFSARRIKLGGAPIYVFQVRAQPPQKWVAKIMRRKADALVEGDSAESVKFAVAGLCSTKVKDWTEGYWDDDVWMPKTSRPAPGQPHQPEDMLPLPTETTRRGRPRQGERV